MRLTLEINTAGNRQELGNWRAFITRFQLGEYSAPYFLELDEEKEDTIRSKEVVTPRVAIFPSRQLHGLERDGSGG